MKLYMFRRVRPSSGVYLLYTQQWYMSYRFVDSLRAGPGWKWFHSVSGGWIPTGPGWNWYCSVVGGWIPTSNRIKPFPSWSCSKAVYKPVWHVPLLSVHWIHSWWWTEELSETCRVSWQNIFVKLVYLFVLLQRDDLRFLQLEIFGLLQLNINNNTQIWSCTSKYVSEWHILVSETGFFPMNACRKLKAKFGCVLDVVQRILLT